MPFVTFMHSPFGRVLRTVLGCALIGLGVFAVGGVWSVIVSIIGLVSRIAGAFDVCLAGPRFGTDFRGHPGRR